MISRISPRSFWLLNALVSTAALGLLGWLLLLHSGAAQSEQQLAFLPALNASMNALAATFLVLGWMSIRRGNRESHKRWMVAAFIASAFFLVGYLLHHYLHGDTRYPGGGVSYIVYLVVLASHVLLSIAVVPGVLAAFFFALRQRFETHRKITKWLTPIWLYVSVTGVLVFVMLRLAGA